jgi:hypothetical protein
MKILLVGVGAAGNKAVVDAVNYGAIKEEDTIIINSTSKDFPASYKGRQIILSDDDTGCGKERSIALDYVKTAMTKGKFNLEGMAEYTTVIIATSVEGGTGSGSAPTIAKFFDKVYKKSVHIIAFLGFSDDVRGLSNTVEFFKEVESNFIIQTISNKAFMSEAHNNKLRAEELANKCMAERISVLSGKDLIYDDTQHDRKQIIDDTDLYKVVNTTGYMTVEKKIINKSLETRDDYNKVIKNMIYNSASVDIEFPKASRIGVIFNIKESSEDAVDFNYDDLKKHYENPEIIYEAFVHKQWDGKEEYIAYIVSGMVMPVKEIESIYEKYMDQVTKIDQSGDSFFSDVKNLEMVDTTKFNFSKGGTEEKGMSVNDFLNQI